MPQAYKGARNLGRWVAKQRQLYWDRKKGDTETRYHPNADSLMNDERIAKLDKLEFKWRLQGVHVRRKRRKIEAAADVDAEAEAEEEVAVVDASPHQELCHAVVDEDEYLDGTI